MKQFIENIGGIFIYSEKPAELAAWYEKALGIQHTHTEEHSAWFADFKYQQGEGDNKQQYALWSILAIDKKPKIEGKTFTVNLRVSNIHETVEHLKSLKVQVKDVEEYPQGKFAWLNDPDGNAIELWENTPA